MFKDLIDFEDKTEDEIIEFLYEIFKEQFIDNHTFLADKIYIDPKKDDIERGMDKPKIYWHIITRKERGIRRLDRPRASRLHWIKLIILNYRHQSVKFFYYYEDNGKIRLYLWAYNKNFAVILQKIGQNNSSYIVTSFYIDNDRKRGIFERKYQNYLNNVDNNLRNCEWF